MEHYDPPGFFFFASPLFWLGGRALDFVRSVRGSSLMFRAFAFAFFNDIGFSITFFFVLIMWQFSTVIVKPIRGVSTRKTHTLLE